MKNINSETCKYMRINGGRLLKFSPEMPDISKGNVTVKYYLTKKLKSLDEEFKGNDKVVKVDLSKMNVEELESLKEMCSGCVNIQEINLGAVSAEVDVEDILKDVWIDDDNVIADSNELREKVQTEIDKNFTEEPTDAPTDEPTDAPTDEPSDEPTDEPSEEPTDAPTDEPSDEPSEEPTDAPTDAPTEEPTDAPSDEPTDAPTDAPTEEPTDAPSDEPTDEPTDAPTDAPSDEPTDEPTNAPTDAPTDEPTDEPTPEPKLRIYYGSSALKPNAITIDELSSTDEDLELIDYEILKYFYVLVPEEAGSLKSEDAVAEVWLTQQIGDPMNAIATNALAEYVDKKTGEPIIVNGFYVYYSGSDAILKQFSIRFN